jgi:F-type H+-transporting ATPase subunit delta
VKTAPGAAKRYAKALYELAQERAVIDDVLADMSAIERLAADSTSLAVFLGDYTLPRDARLGILAELFERRTCPLVWTFLQLIETKRRSGLVPAVCAALAAHHRRTAGIVDAVVESVFPLTDADVASIVEPIGRKTGGHVEAQVRQNPGLLAGFIVRISDVVYDCSAIGALRAARQMLAAGKTGD